MKAILVVALLALCVVHIQGRFRDVWVEGKTDAVEGGQLWLHCVTPLAKIFPVTYRWSNHLGVLSEGSDKAWLIKKNMQLSDAGPYKCTVTATTNMKSDKGDNPKLTATVDTFVRVDPRFDPTVEVQADVADVADVAEAKSMSYKRPYSPPRKRPRKHEGKFSEAAGAFGVLGIVVGILGVLVVVAVAMWSQERPRKKEGGKTIAQHLNEMNTSAPVTPV